jgi:non-heme chloroperoxidase
LISPDILSVAGSGVQLVGERWGEQSGSRPIIVLLHGGGQTRHSWSSTARRLAEHGRTAIALDARGHGDSEWDPQEDYSLDAFVRDLLAFTKTLPRPPVFVGASLGGITALAAVGENPGIAHGLVLVDVVVQVEPAGVDRIRDFMTARPDGFSSLEEVADAVAAYNPLRPRPRNLDGLRKNVRLGADGRWRWHWDPAFMRITDEPQRKIDPRRLRAAARQVRIPTLIVRGGRSDVVSEEGMADMLRLVPAARSVDVAAAGHMVAGDDNDVFAAALERFLAELD